MFWSDSRPSDDDPSAVAVGIVVPDDGEGEKAWATSGVRSRGRSSSTPIDAARIVTPPRDGVEVRTPARRRRRCCGARCCFCRRRAMTVEVVFYVLV